MRVRTIGCVELNSIGLGMETADAMVKATQVELVLARTTCPGRYLIIITGDTGAVTDSVETGLRLGGDMVVDSFVIPNVHADVVPAMNGTALPDPINALGVIETYTAASCVLAADAAAKAGDVSLLELRLSAGLGGKAFVVMTGEVSAVRSSVEAGAANAAAANPVVSKIVIPSPSEELKRQLL